MKILTVAIISSGAALGLAGCSGHGHDGQFDTNSAEIGVDRRPGETNLMVAQRTGASLNQFTYVEPAEVEDVPVVTPGVDRNTSVPPTKKTEQKAQLPAPDGVTQEEYADSAVYESTTTASSTIMEAPKTKKELRKEKKEAKKAAKRNN